MPAERWEVQRDICKAILRGDAEAAFSRHHVSQLDRAIYRRMAEDALDGVVRRRSAARRYYRARIANPILLGTGLAALLSFAALAGALLLLSEVDLSDPKGDPRLSSFVGLCAVVAAATGWGVSGWIAHRNTRSKHTLDIVAARFAQPAFNHAFAEFNKVFDGRIDAALVNRFATSGNMAEREGVQALRYLVNYFEFISVGILSGEFDERIIAKTLRGNLIHVYDRCAFYIAEVQASNPRTLENFTTVRNHYRSL